MVQELAPLLFVRNVSFPLDKYQTYADAILVSSLSTLSLSLNAWSGWIIGEHRVQVECKPIVHTLQSLWKDSHGNLTCSSEDDRFCIPVESSGILRVAENALTFNFKAEFDTISVPFLISTSQGTGMCRVTVQVELAVDRLDMLADVQAFTAFCLYQNDSESIRRAVKIFNRRAMRMKIKAGTYIPAAISLDGQDVPCVIFVRQPLSNTFFSRQARYSAQLYLPSSVSHIPDETILFRDVCWNLGETGHRTHTLIGRVIRSE